MLAGMLLFALERLHARKLRQVGLAGHAGGQHQLLWPQRDLLAIAIHHDRPFLRRVVIGRRFAGGARPVVQLHDVGIHLHPVAKLVLGGKDRPVRRELEIGEVVVPDRVMQGERLVSVAPAVAGAVVLLGDDRRHAKLAQPRAERDTALPAADDQHIGLFEIAQFGLLALAILLPGRLVLGGPVLGPQRTGKA